jgi:hypothetical protein
MARGCERYGVIANIEHTIPLTARCLVDLCTPLALESQTNVDSADATVPPRGLLSFWAIMVFLHNGLTSLRIKTTRGSMVHAEARYAGYDHTARSTTVPNNAELVISGAYQQMYSSRSDGRYSMVPCTLCQLFKVLLPCG